MTEREKIAARIRGLRDKTTANGCTEEEAMSAAEKVVEMLARYNMTLDEAELRASPFSQREDTHADHVGDRIWKVAAAIAKLIGVTYWQSPTGVSPVKISFFGFSHEVEIASYLLEVCAGAMRSEQLRILRGATRAFTPRQRSRLYPFLDGMADRLATRLLELIPPVPPGTGLVVLRSALIAQAMELEGIDLQAGLRSRPSRDADEAYELGKLAGDRVSLNQGLRGPTTTQGLLT